MRAARRRASCARAAARAARRRARGAQARQARASYADREPRLRRHPRQGRRALPRRAARRARARGRRRDARDRLRLARRLAARSRAPPASSCSRSRPRSSATAARATSAPSARSGELICFLTQDATPVPGWLEAYREAFALDERVGAAFGPHLPRPDTSPMIARELSEFFAGFSPDGTPVVQRARRPDVPLERQRRATARDCWEEIRFRDVPYAEDQAFGARPARRRLAKVYHPRRGGPARARLRRARVHAPLLRRVPRAARDDRPRRAVRRVRDAARRARARSAADRAGCASAGLPRRRARALGAARGVHHGGRRVFSALGSRAERLPAPRARERSRSKGARDAAAARAAASGAPPRRCRPPAASSARHDPRLRRRRAQVLREGPAPLLDPVPGMAERERLRLALVMPPLRRGSGGHNTLFQLLSRLERRGHSCSVWVARLHGELDHTLAGGAAPADQRLVRAVRRRRSSRASTTGTAPTSRSRPAGRRSTRRCCSTAAARAPTSSTTTSPSSSRPRPRSALAEDTYRHGLHCIAASPWLRDLVDRALRRAGRRLPARRRPRRLPAARASPRRRDTVVFYARHSTARRAVPIGLMALAELHRRRPQTRDRALRHRPTARRRRSPTSTSAC